jgi:hypothetical protein
MQQKSYFSKTATGSNACVHLELVASLQDQPEHRASNYLMLGSGKYSTRWGHSADISSLIAKILLVILVVLLI